MATTEGERGREADSSQQIPKLGWRDVLLRVKNDVNENNLSMVAAGVAYYSFLAVFPAMAAAVSLYGLIADPKSAQKMVDAFGGGAVPAGAISVIGEELTRLTSASGSALGFGLVASVVLALWSANSGMKALVQALDIVYDETEERGFIKLNASTLLLTTVATVFVGVMGLVAVGLPEVLKSSFAGVAMVWLRWPVIALCVMFALAALYRFGPDRRKAKWRWVSWGATAATLVWIAGSLLFSLYASKFGNFDKTYGTMGAVAILLVWFYLSAYAVLIGAQLNAELERQTKRDSTPGREKLMGRRRARAADTLGESHV